MRIAIIPARGGSKRIPRKNIKLFSGRPMICYAIDAAVQSQLFDRVFVSTEDDEISSMAQRAGAEVPFMRLATLADDYTPTVPVVADFISRLVSHGLVIESVCCIYPCVPLLTPSDLRDGYNIFAGSTSSYVFPIVRFRSPIQRALFRSEDGSVSPFYPDNVLTRSQDLVPAYHDAGQYYWGPTNLWLQHAEIHTNALTLVMPEWKAVDIDTHDDWERASRFYDSLRNKR